MAKTNDRINQWKNVASVSWAIVGVAAVVWVIAILLEPLKVVVPIFIYTMALVYVLRPSVEKLNSRGIPRALAVVITYLIVIALIALLFWYLIPIVSSQFMSFAEDVPTKFYPKLQAFGNNVLQMYQSRLGEVLDIDKFVASYSMQAKKFGIGIIAGLPKATMDFFGGMLNLILAPILAFYILKDMSIIKETIMGLVPRDYRDEVLTIIRKTNAVISGFLKGQLTVSFIVGLLASIWFVIIGLDFPFVLGMIAGALNIIPYLGPVIGGLLAATVAGFSFTNPILGISLVVVGMLSIQQLDSAIISPQVMRRHVNLHPVSIVFGLLIGSSLFGIMGMLLAIPVLAVVKVLLYHFVSKQDIF